MADAMTQARLNMILAAEDQGAAENVSTLLETVAKIGPAGTDAATALTEGMANATAAIDAATESAAKLLDTLNSVAARVGAVFGRAGAAIGEDVSQGASDAGAAIQRVSSQAAATAEEISVRFGGAAVDISAFGADAQAAIRAAMEQGTAAVQTFTEATATDGTEAATALSDAFQSSIATITDNIATLRADLDAVTATAEASAASISAALTATAEGSGAAAATTAVAGEGVAAAGAKGEAGGAMGGLLGAGMTGWMGMMGMQMLAQSAKGPTNILSTLQAMGGGTPGEAERLMGELGVAGIHGSAVPGMLSGLSSKLQGMSTFVGAGGLPKGALLAMQNMGYTGSNPFMQIAALHSPAQQINAIMGVYSQLSSKGMGTAGSAMLSQLGLSQLAPVAPQWQQLRKQFSGFNLGYSSHQLGKMSQQGMSLSVALEKVSMVFTTFASAIAGPLSRVVNAFAGAAQALAGKGGKPGAHGAEGGGGGGNLFGRIGAAFRSIDQAFGGGWTGRIAAGAAGVAGAMAILKAIRWTYGTLSTMVLNVTTFARWASSLSWDGSKLQSLVTAVSGFAQALGNGAGPAAKAILGYAKSLGGAIADFLAAATDAIVPLIVVFGPWALLIAAAVALVLLAIWKWKYIKQAAEAVGAAIDAAWRAVKKFMQDFGDAFGAAALAAWSAIKDAADKLAAAFKSLVQKVRAAITQGVPQLLAHAKELVQNFIDGIGTAIGSLAADIMAAARNFVSTIWNDIKTSLGSVGGLLGSIFGGGSKTGTPAASATKPLQGSALQGVLQFAEQKAGVAGKWGAQGLQDLMSLVQQESGGNPSAVNPTGVNYGGGQGVEHAQGLMQLMPSTFAAYGGAAYGAITNPVANAVAGVQYIMSRYGSPQNIPGIGTSSYKGYASGGIISEPISGIGASGQRYMFGEAGAEAIVPLGAGAGGLGAAGGLGGGTHTIALTVTVDSNTPLGRQAAQQVAQEIVNQLKLRGKFDMGPA